MTDQGWFAKESFVVGEVPNARGATPDKLDPFTVAFLAACQGLAELLGNEGVTQLVRSIHAEPRQATALLTSMLTFKTTNRPILLNDTKITQISFLFNGFLFSASLFHYFCLNNIFSVPLLIYNNIYSMII